MRFSAIFFASLVFAMPAFADCASSSHTAHNSKILYLYDLPGGRDRSPDEDRRAWTAAIRDHVRMLEDCGILEEDQDRFNTARVDTARALMLSRLIGQDQLMTMVGFLNGVAASDAGIREYFSEIVELENRNQSRRQLWAEFERYQSTAIMTVRPANW